MDSSLPGSSVHGIFQARVVEWGAIALSGSKERDLYFKPQGVGYLVYVTSSSLGDISNNVEERGNRQVASLFFLSEVRARNWNILQ